MTNSLKFFIFLFFLIAPVITFSQRWKLQRAEFTVGAGGADYYGDIEPRSGFPGIKSIDLSYVRPNVNIGGRYRVTERENIRATLSFGYLEGSDKGTENASRNYAFLTSIYELKVQYEYSLIPENNPVNYSLGGLWDGLQSNNANLNTYLFGGLGAVYFSPLPKNDLKNSDRFNDSKNLAVILPLGAGIKYPVASSVHVGFEIGRRFTTTDLLDGFTSKYSNWPDSYYFSSIYVALKLNTSPRRFNRSLF